MAGEQEVLAPIPRNADGTFGAGNNYGQGRPPGETNRYNKEIKDMVREALEMVGGANYLAMMAITNPGPFLALVGKTLPLKLQGDPEAPVQFVVTKRLVVRAPLPGEND